MQVIYSADFSALSHQFSRARWNDIQCLTAQREMESALRYLPPMGTKIYMKRFRKLVEACNRFAVRWHADIEVAIDKERRTARINMLMAGFIVVTERHKKRFSGMRYAHDYFVLPSIKSGENGRNRVSVMVGFDFYNSEREFRRLTKKKDALLDEHEEHHENPSNEGLSPLL